MRSLSLTVVCLGLWAGGACAQQDPFDARLEGSISSGIGSSLESGLGGGLQSGLGIPTRRTLADPYNPYGNRGAGGQGCVPGQADPDHTGCRPYEWITGDAARSLRQPDPNRVVIYSGDSAFRSGSQ